MSSKIQVKAGNILIGGGAPISEQSMLNVPSTDSEGSMAQAKRLEDAGCQIIRAAIPDMDAVRLIPALKEAVLAKQDARLARFQARDAWAELRTVLGLPA